MSMIDLLPPDRGHDPYNHVGRQIQRYEAQQAMSNKLTGKVLVMDTPTLDMLSLSTFHKECLDEIRNKFMIPSLMGVPVVRHDAAFKIKTEV